jgi:hypothetical protein
MIMKIMFYERFFMTNSRIESLFNLINLLSKSETICESFITFTMFESIITSNLIAQKSASCWRSFDSIEIMSEHLNKSNELKIIMKFFFESSKNENMKSMTSQISTTRRFIFSNRLLNQIVTSDTLFSMIDTSDSLHLMINMMLSTQFRFSYAYSAICDQFEYNYHFDFSFFQSSSSDIASIRAFEFTTINQSFRVENQHARFVFFLCICLESACSFCIVICSFCFDLSKFNRWKLLWIDTISTRIKFFQEIVAIEQNL